MNTHKKNWIDGPPVTTSPFEHIATHRQISNLERFLAPRWPDDLHNPLLLPDMTIAVKRIWQAVEAGQTIGIVGDYDMDGTPAAVLLHDFLRLIGVTPKVILPTRADGYGFATEFATRLAKQGVKLIITVDCGVRDSAAVDAAKQQGLDVIITDHHDCPAELPQAFAVVNPKRSDSQYPFRELCGTGVAFKLTQALIEEAPSQFRSRISPHWLAWSLDLVALATIGDMVPLIDENRVLTHYGLKVLQKNKRPGLRRFLQAIELDASTLTARDVAFKLIPKCNASGRMESMEDVFLVLSSQNTEVIDAAVSRILSRSTQSQLLLTTMLEQAHEKLNSQELGSVIVLADDAWHPGLTGLVAARLAEEYARPVGILAGGEEAVYRGSMRGRPGVNLPEMLHNVGPLLEKFGGHEQAAGLTLAKENLPALQAQLANQLLPNEDVMNPVFTTDGIIKPESVNVATLRELERFAPWGMGHPEPMWSVPNITLREIRWLSDGKHVKALIPGTGAPLTMIYFGADAARPFLGQPVDICGTLTINEFRGRQEPQLMVKNLVPTQTS